MVIKTITSFTSRPLVWFALLAIPVTMIGLLTFGYSLWAWLGSSAEISLPLAGTGLIFLASAFILLCSGALGELVYKLGDMRDQEFSRLTQQVWTTTKLGQEAVTE